MKKLILYALLISLIGCTKETTSVPVNAVESSSIKTNVSAADTYLPLTSGTYWKYHIQTDLTSDRSRLTVTGLQKKINGKNYTAINGTSGGSSDTVYYNQTQHNYYVYTNQSIDDASVMNIEILFLKDDVPVGSSWTQSAGSADGVSLKCYGKILEKNINYKVGDSTYKNVIHSYVELRKSLFLFYVVVDKQEFYAAKNVGIIKNISTQLLPAVLTTTTNITDYDVK